MTNGSATGFVNGVRAYQVAVGDLSTKTVRELSIFALQKLVEMSPVGNPDLWESPPPPGYVGGRFRGNWQVTTAEPAKGEIPDIDPGGGATMAKGVAVAQKIPDGAYPRVWITNNLPYVERLEDGWSRQAPQGVLAPTFQLLESVAQALVDSTVARDDARGNAPVDPMPEGGV